MKIFSFKVTILTMQILYTLKLFKTYDTNTMHHFFKCVKV